jgi:hypothetical protein
MAFGMALINLTRNYPRRCLDRDSQNPGKDLYRKIEFSHHSLNVFPL